MKYEGKWGTKVGKQKKKGTINDESQNPITLIQELPHQTISAQQPEPERERRNQERQSLRMTTRQQQVPLQSWMPLPPPSSRSQVQQAFVQLRRLPL